ncbi:MAG: SDR family NAD(P)-dependent oxidoreductase [Hydrogenophaga sp.]|jgi:NAD(P)-dependent dehydrogenase (short-subunit alcohol dehydrogenase family)|uniref:SDR family NAD(P)-dependent oxidoreductase n=1 Tax=Hydrogenophaga sp. TaxID=1904254 RepID=UPI00120535B7|nr:SDR family NAD(P)-dependent oxidoreductase [Hydrogenophaga sp.]MBP6504074.1 SDR family NAD(P)-dependent oxidoreductase [Rhodoferax sp.]RZL96164.1 MAG: SDR family NAD(P)-dependent oxidoreductase [Variovorax sp.]MDO9133969.1 SDR family NAD(P)-dependent oxidoreductase [Hydrogenophaga sp.]MDO9505954.1 SDR family NAD(P)-dependent oxidoreductase [Hydrogenophaga sp.]MDP1783078.1 SDR family NAD(P)-dependent oxidoreductase [Hydrogenophaga sp.]
MDIKNTVALVTGAGSGLGLATCKALVDAGAKVVAVDVDDDRLMREMVPLGDSVRALKTDVANDASVKAAVEFAVNTFGALHVAVNCAGILGPCKTLSKGELFPLDLWNRVIGVNLTGTFNVIRHAALAMSQNDANADGERGVIVNTSSGAAWQGQMGQAAYSASKAAVMGLTLPVARDLAQHGVRVVALAPGLFETGMSAGMPTKVAQNIIEKVILFPNRMGQAPEFSALVRHVVENAYLNATTLSIDGGARL